MPIYKYRCEECEVEKIISHSLEDPKPVCPECDSHRMQKVYKTLKKSSAVVESLPGDLVKDFIKEARSDLKDQKKESKSRERQ